MNESTTDTASGTTRDTGPDTDLDRISLQRAKLVTRHSQALTGLMGQRDDLRGVHAMADFVDDAVRWTA